MKLERYSIIVTWKRHVQSVIKNIQADVVFIVIYKKVTVLRHNVNVVSEELVLKRMREIEKNCSCILGNTIEKIEKVVLNILEKFEKKSLQKYLHYLGTNVKSVGLIIRLRCRLTTLMGMDIVIEKLEVVECLTTKILEKILMIIKYFVRIVILLKESTKVTENQYGIN